MEFRIRLLVVTYLTPFSESETISSIIRFFKKKPESGLRFTLSVWDNSPNSRRDEFDGALQGTTVEKIYISTPENLALCSVYNRTISERAGFDYLCILDQDTQLTEEYFDELLALAARNISLALPQIYSNDSLYSPSYRKFCLGRHFPQIAAGKRSSKNMLAVNSGMFISRAVFDKIRYDERIKFYGTDTWFMVQYEKNFPELNVMEAKLRHSLRIQQENTPEWRRNYYKNQILINEIVFSDGLAERLVTWMYCKYLRIFHARG